MAPEEMEAPTNELRSIREICKDLSKPIAQKHLKTRRQGGKEITYVPWHLVISYLDHYCPTWNYEITRVDSIAGKLILTVRISILCAEGLIYREATGQEDEDYEIYGNASSNAESMALRRACAKFGLGRHLYSPETPVSQPNQTRHVAERSNPPAPKITPAEAIAEKKNLLLSIETLLGNCCGDDEEARQVILKGRKPEMMTIPNLQSLVKDLQAL